MILNQVYVDATYGLQCIQCDNDHRERFCRESSDNIGHAPFTAFTVTLNHKSIRWRHGEIVKYTRVLTNIGNTYNTHTGIFTVKTDGVYAVSAAAIGGPGQCTHYSIMKNGQVMVWLFTGPAFDMAAQTINLALRKGDRLWIKIAGHYVLITHVVHPYHHFSAVLIKPGKF
ncbi:C1QL [Mytilus edulis]|uniref:C1QL n=1 Tax=Mytilus edulis TaxID=6550 RepID=A0A8S3U3L3_MYTED|nr:C1QL [Mytilus edulis]